MAQEKKKVKMFKVLKDAVAGNIPFYILMGVAIILLVISFFLPPVGEINSSVMLGTSELFCWAALWAVIRAIDKGQTATVKKGELEITINDKEEDQD